MLTVKDIGVEYYGEELATLGFDFCEGVTLLLGEVGSFKTTLFKIIGGIKEIKKGEIILDGQNIEELPPKKRDMAYVGEASAPYGRVGKALSLPLKLRGVKRKQALMLASEAAQKFGLDIKAKAERLTGKELALFFEARLSMRSSRVVMFDEPFFYMGEENADLITKIIKEQGGYTLVSSCDGADIGRLRPDYIYVLRGDKILQHGRREDVINNPVDKYVSMFINM